MLVHHPAEAEQIRPAESSGARALPAVMKFFRWSYLFVGITGSTNVVLPRLQADNGRTE